MPKKTILPLLIFVLFSFQIQAQSILINEVMSSNSYTIADEDGEFTDWIEIFNAGSISVDLQGYGLSDDYEQPFRWVFPEIQLPAGGYMLLWASGKDRINPGSPLHTNFSISAAGEEIILTRPDGTLADELIPTPIPTDISYGRKPDAGDTWFYFQDPTPGQANETHGYSGLAPEPTFSHHTGFYSEAFSLAISSTLEGTQIYYTLDGSEPTEESILYSGPISITSLEGTPNDLSIIPTNDNNDPGPPYYEGWQPPAGEVFKVTVIRAKSVKENHLEGKIATHSFLVDPLAENRYTLPVFFLTTHRDNFFDPEIGIYIPGNYNNMFQSGPEWERPIHLAFYEADGSFGFATDMGVRLHGNTTRSRPRKSLRLYARGDYGDSWINYPLFPEKENIQYKRFLLRNSGNDWDQAIFRDGFIQYLAQDLHVETQHYRPAVVFLNGEYWGIHNIRDRYDEHYIFSHYGLEEDEMVILQNNSDFAYGNPGGVNHYNNMRSFINNNNMAVQSNYEQVTTLMDPRSFIDAHILNIYAMNTDWPGNNTNYWRKITAYDPHAQAGHDGRWRWHILDADFGFGLDFFYVPGVNEGPAHNTLAMAMDPNGPGWPNPSWSTFLLRKLTTNTGFRNDFINRFADMLNTTFSATAVTAVLDSIETTLAPEMAEHIDRWRRPVDMQEWQQNVQRMRNFSQQRPAYMRQYIRNQFGISGTYYLQISVNDGQRGAIALNTIEPDVSNDWGGIYFKGIPVKLQALPKPGFIFSHWSGTQSSDNQNWEVSFNADANLKAHFIPDPDFQGDELNPKAHKLLQGPYFFDSWDENQAEGTFPAHMLFLQSAMSDPGLDDEMTHRYHIPENDYHADDQASIGFPYRLTGRTRLNGLENEGISFINTGRTRDLGAAVLAIDTRGIEDISVAWTGGTLIPNARVYAIRLQYKIGIEGAFINVTDENGNWVEYHRSDIEGHSLDIGPILLPAETNNQEYVQLRWKYYFTGTQLDLGHGRRDMLRLDNIEVTTLNVSNKPTEDIRNSPILMQNYPNPATGQTHISFYLTKPTQVSIEIYDMMGRNKLQIANGFFDQGTHTLPVNLEEMQEGIYFYQLQADDFYAVKKMIVR